MPRTRVHSYRTPFLTDRSYSFIRQTQAQNRPKKLIKKLVKKQPQNQLEKQQLENQQLDQPLSPKPNSLIALPVELILSIMDALSMIDVVCLAMCNSRLFDILRQNIEILPQTEPEWNEKQDLRQRLERDLPNDYVCYPCVLQWLSFSLLNSPTLGRDNICPYMSWMFSGEIHLSEYVCPQSSGRAVRTVSLLPTVLALIFNLQ